MLTDEDGENADDCSTHLHAITFRPNGPGLVTITEEDITFSDDDGEILYWHLDEVRDDPITALSIAHAVAFFMHEGAEALRDRKEGW